MMRTQTSRSKKPTSQKLPQAKEVTQPPLVEVPLMQTSNEEGLAAWEIQRQKWERFGTPWMDKVPNLSGEINQPWIQPKLTIGQPNDKYEKEADRVAKQVVTNINYPDFVNVPQGRSVQHQGWVIDNLQAKPEVFAKQQGPKSIGGTLPVNLESAINQARGSGRQLDMGLQQSMGQVMNADFSRVRVHTDVQSDRLSQSIQAKAFTTGQDVFFRKGEYQPHSKHGQELIAHELTHVVQQQGQSVSNSIIQRAINWKVANKDIFFPLTKCFDQGLVDDSLALFEYMKNCINGLKVAIEYHEKTNDISSFLIHLGKKKISEYSEFAKNIDNWKKIIKDWDSIGPEKLNKYISFLAAKGPKNTYAKAVVGRFKQGIGKSTSGERYTYTFYQLEDAFRTILAEDYREASTEKEVKLADEVLLSDMKEQIKYWIVGFINNFTKDARYLKVKEFMINAEYKDYFGGKISDVLDNPEDESISGLISALHDATTILFEMSEVIYQIDNPQYKPRDKHLVKHGEKINFYKLIDKGEISKEVANYVAVPPDKDKANYYINLNNNSNNNNNSNSQNQEDIKHVRPGYLNESKSEVLKQLRKNKILVEIGPSYTTGRLIQLCETFGAKPKTKLAIALAIFAFWNKGYDKAVSGIHRFHFVMDMCKNYVPQLKYENEYPNSIAEIWNSL